MLAFMGIGVQELVIVAVIVVILFVVPILVVIAVLFAVFANAKRKGRG